MTEEWRAHSYHAFADAVRESFEAFVPYGFVKTSESWESYGVFFKYENDNLTLRMGYDYREGVLFDLNRKEGWLVPAPHQPVDREAHDSLIPHSISAEQVYVLRTGRRLVYYTGTWLSGEELARVVREHVEAMLSVAEDVLKGDLSVFRAVGEDMRSGGPTSHPYDEG